MEYPALEDIYDLPTDELKSIELQLQQSSEINGELLETIQLEIEERKTLEYFAQLCEVENPYAKKVTEFNYEFLRLAQETIQRNQNTNHNHTEDEEVLRSSHNQVGTNLPQEHNQQHDHMSRSQPKQFPIKPQEIKEYDSQSRKETDNDSISVQSEVSNKTDQITVNTHRSRSKESSHTQSVGRPVTQKMGLGFNKKKKKKVSELMESTLARTKVEAVITIKRSSAQSPKKNLYDKKYHIPGEKHGNLQLQNKVAPKRMQAHHTNNPVNHTSNKMRQEAIKRNNEIVNRTKNETAKSTSVRLPKLNNRDLVAMIKQEEEQKKVKTQKSISEKEGLPPINTKSEMLIRSDRSNQGEDPIEEDIETDRVKTQLEGGGQPQEEIKEEIFRDCTEPIKEEELEESVSPSPQEKMMYQACQLSGKLASQLTKQVDSEAVKEIRSSTAEIGLGRSLLETTTKVEQANGYEQSRKKQIKNQLTVKENGNLSEAIKDLKYINNENEAEQILSRHRRNKAEQLEREQHQSILALSESCNKQQLSQSSKEQQPQQQNANYQQMLLEQISQQESKQHLIESAQSQLLKHSEQQEQHRQTSEQLFPQAETNKQIESQRKCYSQEYWANVREEAELKIKRFKQQKQIQETQKINENIPESCSDSDAQCEEDINSCKDSKTETEDKLLNKTKADIAQKQQYLKKMRKLMTDKNKKVVQAAPPPKIIRPRPQFDYLSIYPTFNHIFSVMYLKPTHHALAQIPNIMRDIKSLFLAHQEHFRHKPTFQPALFLPFDRNGAFEMKDPKQLVLHAENTYVDLKVMMSRIETFNTNLQGQFSNANNNQFYRVVKSKQQVYDIITTSFLRRKAWKQLPHGSGLRASWNLFWSWSKPDIDMNKLLVWQRINHFPFNKNLSRKDLLYKNLEHFKKNYRVAINFLPLTFNLPKEFTQLSIKFHEEEMLNKDKNYWIMKPIGKSRGRGIKVISSLSELNYFDNIVVQKYISNPLLLDGYKFDMRIYVLVTSFHPLQAFVYKEGFARLSTEKFNLSSNSIHNTFIHLTNFSINKNNLQAKSNFIGGSKISLKNLKNRLTKMGYSYNSIWSQIHDIIIKSLLGCSISVPSFPTAFELFGYDVMIDDTGNCHLIEINASPSLERSFIIDEIIKQNLIDDIFDIVDTPDFDKSELLDVFTERLQMMTDRKKITEEDDLIGLARILKYKPLRKVGETPPKMGLFEMVAPCPASMELQKLFKGKSCSNNPQNID